MFGYLRPYRPEWKIKDDALFKTYYCGICKALGKRSGPLCRALLRYDLAFLSLVRDSVSQDAVGAPGRCPLKGTKIILQSGPAIDYCADAHLILTAVKFADDRRDGQYLSALGQMALHAPIRRARLRMPEIDASAHAMMARQAQLEQARCADPDEAAQPFSDFLGDLFAHGMPDCAREGLRFMGSNIGKWIYWLDALDDYDDDAKKGSYNVWQLSGRSREEAVLWALPLLSHCCEQAALAYDLISSHALDPLVVNILREGMPRTMDDVAEGRKPQDGSV